MNRQPITHEELEAFIDQNLAPAPPTDDELAREFQQLVNQIESIQDAVNLRPQLKQGLSPETQATLDTLHLTSMVFVTRMAQRLVADGQRLEELTQQLEQRTEANRQLATEVLHLQNGILRQDGDYQREQDRLREVIHSLEALVQQKEQELGYQRMATETALVTVDRLTETVADLRGENLHLQTTLVEIQEASAEVERMATDVQAQLLLGQVGRPHPDFHTLPAVALQQPAIAHLTYTRICEACNRRYTTTVWNEPGVCAACLPVRVRE